LENKKQPTATFDSYRRKQHVAAPESLSLRNVTPNESPILISNQKWKAEVLTNPAAVISILQATLKNFRGSGSQAR